MRHDPDSISRWQRYGPLLAVWVIALAAAALLNDELKGADTGTLFVAAAFYPAGLFFFAGGGGLFLGVAVYGVLMWQLVRTTEKDWYKLLLAVLCVLLAVNVYGCQHVELNLGH
jgi:hypothetical protein